MIEPVVLGTIAVVLSTLWQLLQGGGPGSGGCLGEGGSPLPAPGGRVYGTPRQRARYVCPRSWDPHRGLWISPDCSMVVEGPGFWIGLGGAPGTNTVDPHTMIAYPASSLAEVWADKVNGAAGLVETLLEQGLAPEEVVGRIVREVAPACASKPRSQWGEGLRLWWDIAVRHVIEIRDGSIDAPFEP